MEITGWGSTEYEEAAENLQVAYVPFLSQTECAKFHPKVSKKQMCTFNNDRPVGPCTGNL
jgi:hypothetical protein